MHLRLFLLFGFVHFSLLAEDAEKPAAWPQFRGTNSQGIAEDNKPPRAIGPGTNQLWKMAVPPGFSSPCIWENHLFLTGVEEGKLQIICLDRQSGKVKWSKAPPVEKLEEVHKASSPASATPATDGKRVYAYFPPSGMFAYDFEGNQVWHTPLEIDFVVNGSGTSPALIEDKVVVNCDQQGGKSFLVALAADTGKEVWRTPRPGFFSSYATPVHWRDEVVLPGSLRVVGYNLADGKERWSARGLEAVSVCPTAVFDSTNLYIMSRSFGGASLPAFSVLLAGMDENKDQQLARSEVKGMLAGNGIFEAVDVNKDKQVNEAEWTATRDFIGKGEHGIFRLSAPENGDVTDTHVVWKSKRGVAGVASPLLYKGRLYTVQDGGRVTCFEALTGRVLFEQERLGAEGEYYASPVAADSRIFFASTRGRITGLLASDAFEVVLRADLKEPIMATPAIADSKFYIRSAENLWAFGETVRR